jgi:hypothetical protein
LLEQMLFVLHFGSDWTGENWSTKVKVVVSSVQSDTYRKRKM